MPVDRITPVVELLVAHGFVQDGQTATEHVRIPTVRSPVFGGIGGEAATFGGRARFAIPNTKIKVTVGQRSTYFYDVVGEKTPYSRRMPEIKSLGSFESKDVEAIKAFLAEKFP